MTKSVRPTPLGCREEGSTPREPEEKGFSQEEESKQENQEEKRHEGEDKTNQPGEPSNRTKENEDEPKEETVCLPCGESEEGRDAKVARTPAKVSDEERKRHELTHTHTISGMV